MTSAPLVSFGLPVYNGERFLPEALDSLLGQTVRDLEVVIADNASTDATAAICLEYAARDPRIRYVRNPENIGGSPNHNRVFTLSRGTFFAWCGADDVRPVDFLERAVAALERDGNTVLCLGSTRWIDEYGHHVRTTHWTLPTDDPRPDDRFRAVIDMGHMIDTSYGLIRSAVLRQTHLEEPYPDSDRVLAAELALHGTFRVLDGDTLLRRTHTGQSTRQFPDRRTRVAWSRPDAPVLLAFPYWRQLRGYLEAILRAPIPASVRARCASHMAAWIWANRADLGDDLIESAKDLARPPLRLLGVLPRER